MLLCNCFEKSLEVKEILRKRFPFPLVSICILQMHANSDSEGFCGAGFE